MHRFTALEQERLAKGLPPWESMSFACGGWLQFYMYGVCKALQVSGLDKDVDYCGCSAGALAAAGIALGGDFDHGVKYCKEECIPAALGSFTGLTSLHRYVGGCADECFTPVFTVEKAARCHLATTKLPYFTAERVRNYESAADFKSALLASCAAFPVAKLEVRNGVYCIDGGLSDFQPVIDENTITVSPFYFSDADIKPSRYVPIWWAFLPPNSSDTCDWLYSLGFEDGVAYIKKRGILQHIKRECAPAILELFSKEERDYNKLLTDSQQLQQQCEEQQQKPNSDNKLPNGYLSSDSSSIARNTRSKSSTDLLQLDYNTPSKRSHSNNNTISITNNSSRSKRRSSGSILSSPAARALRKLVRDISQVCRLHRGADTPPHPYDTPRRVSMHRFLGYDMRNLTDNKVSFVLDLFLLFLLVAVWKPLALLLIYMELLVRVVFLSLCTVLGALAGLSSASAGKVTIRSPESIGNGTCSYKSKSSGEKLRDCVHCVLSLSLLLRFISGRPSSVELRKHDRLAKLSLLYRVFRHII